MKIKKLLSILLIGIMIVSCKNDDTSQKSQVVIHLQEKGADISPSMYGVFFEEINNAGDGGLYAELVQNRSFQEHEMPEGYHVEGNELIPKRVFNHVFQQYNERSFPWSTEPVKAWSLSADEKAAAMKLTKYRSNFETAPNNLEVTIHDASKPVQLINSGYWGMGIAEGEKYNLRVIIRKAPDYNGTVVAKLLSEKGDVLASASVETGQPNEWHDFKLQLTSRATDPKAKLALEFDATGKVWVDYVSLFPENTFNNRPNGLRKDVAQILADLKPAFFRWPGGCVVEGISLSNRFDWKKTLGDPASRPGEYSLWGYRCSYGFGYYEMLQFCEDIGADAMYVCNVGLACHYRMGDACSAEEVPEYIQDCLNAIEYAIGDVTTVWGARRAADGHPEPFPLKYVEVGNENFGETYDHRFNLFYDAIKEKYPQIVVIYNEMPQRKGPAQIAKTDMIDPHWYEAPEFFFKNEALFDKYERGKYTVYVGEYACNKGVGGGNMNAALSEAAFIGGMERNGDLVTMTSYAPLFENVNNRNWETNLIWINSEKVMGRSSYYVQQMASRNRPSYNVANEVTQTETEKPSFNGGSFGLGSWRTHVEYKDVRVTQNGQTTEINIDQFEYLEGEWENKENSLFQSSLEPGTKALIKGISGDEYVFECKARKIDGSEGFLFYWGMTPDGKNGYMYNIGGWANSSIALQKIADGKDAGIISGRKPYSVKDDTWIDMKIIVTPRKAEVYMDGVLVQTSEPQSVPLRFVHTGYDEASGELIVKVVNAMGQDYPVDFTLDGALGVERTGKVITLAATSGEEENTMDDPLKIAPAESEFNKFGETFSYIFKPFSYTILRIKAKK